MTVHPIRPDVGRLLDQIAEANAPSVIELGPAGARDAMRRMAKLDAPEIALPVRRDLEMPGPSGQPIALRLFDSQERRPSGPVLLYLHGGGFTIGDLDSYASLCSAMSQALDLPVVAVDYRLAPEHPWPAAPDDCEAAARWVASGPEALGLDIEGLVIAGDSAGGALTAVTAMALRDRPAAVPAICQWLLYPTVDMNGGYDSMKEFAKGYFLATREIAWFNSCYAPQADDWRASPLLGEADGLPPAVVHAAGLDPLRDQARAFAAKLVQAGVSTTYLEAQGTVHGFAMLRGALPSAKSDLGASLDAVKALIARR